MDRNENQQELGSPRSIESPESAESKPPQGTDRRVQKSEPQLADGAPHAGERRRAERRRIERLSTDL